MTTAFFLDRGLWLCESIYLRAEAFSTGGSTFRVGREGGRCECILMTSRFQALSHIIFHGSASSHLSFYKNWNCSGAIAYSKWN